MAENKKADVEKVEEEAPAPKKEKVHVGPAAPTKSYAKKLEEKYGMTVNEAVHYVKNHDADTDEVPFEIYAKARDFLQELRSPASVK